MRYLPRLSLWTLLALFAATLGLRAVAAPAIVIVTAAKPSAGLTALPALLADWRETGLVSDAFLLDSTTGKPAAFSATAVLEFPNEASLSRWQAVGAVNLGADLVVTPVTRLARGETFPRDSTKATFLVAEYDVKVDAAAYKAYVDGYVAPEMEAMRLKKVLTSFFVYVPKDPTNAPWQSILLMEYRDEVAYGRREDVMKATRTSLMSDATFKQLSDTKSSIRTEKSLTEAVWTLLPAPALADLPSYKQEYKVTGTIHVLGSFLKFATANLMAEFLKYQPDAQFSSNFSTSSEGAIGGLCSGISDVAPAGDDAKIQDMMPFYNTHGYLPTEIAVATGDYEKRGAMWPAAIVVNKDNPLAHLNIDQLDRIFGAERTGGWDIGHNLERNILFTSEFARTADTNIRTWGQLGLTGEFADKPIQTYGYIAPGFAVYFQRKVMHWSTKYNPNFKEYVEPKLAEDGPAGTPVSVDTMLEDISKDKYGIGWVAMFHAKYYPNVKVIALAPAATTDYVDYTPETVSNRTYPLARDCYFYIDKEPGHPLDPKVREFMRFILSREGQQVIAHTGFFYPLTAAALQEQLKKLD